LKLPIRINRETPPPSLQPFTNYFKGFEKIGAVRAVFGEKTEAVLENLKVAFISYRQMYMGIRDEDGNIAVGTHHLRNSDVRTLYLDIVHELFHIKQYMDDGEYFHREHMKFMRDRSLYYVSPIEIPAYRHTVREAERIGMSCEEIAEYLKMGEAPAKTFGKFLKAMELKREGGTPAGKARLPVTINRDPQIQLYPFTDYFEGFEKVPAVRALLGNRTDAVLAKTMVEFVDSPFESILPSEDDGHLVASTAYTRNGSVKSIYLDIFLCLNFLKRVMDGRALIDPEEQEFGESAVVLESYKAMVEEARRMKMSDADISQRLQLPRFMMSSAAYTRFMHELRLSPG
jgi:hypothetical protein